MNAFRKVSVTAKNLLALLFALSAATQGQAQPKEFVLHAPQVEGSPTAIWISRTYEEVFRRLNIPCGFSMCRIFVVPS